jgi:hypothetical protein
MSSALAYLQISNVAFAKRLLAASRRELADMFARPAGWSLKA